MANGNTRFIGVHIDKDLGKKVKMKCAELDITISHAVVEGLKMYLDIEDEPKQEQLTALERR